MKFQALALAAATFLLANADVNLRHDIPTRYDDKKEEKGYYAQGYHQTQVYVHKPKYSPQKSTKISKPSVSVKKPHVSV